MADIGLLRAFGAYGGLQNEEPESKSKTQSLALASQEDRWRKKFVQKQKEFSRRKAE